MFSFYQIFGNNLLKAAQIHLSYSNQLQCDVLEPSCQFSQSIIDQNTENMARIHRVILLFLINKFNLLC